MVYSDKYSMCPQLFNFSHYDIFRFPSISLHRFVSASVTAFCAWFGFEYTCEIRSMNHGAGKAHELLVNIRGTDATVAAESSHCNHLNIDWVFSRVS